VTHPVPGTCPVCGETLGVRRLHCRRCDTAVEGHFELPRLARLSPEQQDFVETFLKVRGNIREMERELGVSYPTVRSRLDEILRALGHRVERSQDQERRRERRREILDALSRGELTADEAVRRLRDL